jgi:hypothetical protein
MFNYFLIFILLIIASCKPKSESGVFKPPAYNVHIELQPYVETFKEKMLLAGLSKSTNHLQANLSESLLPGEVGRCTLTSKNGGTISSILISKSIWELMTVENREEVLYHELAHCVLERKAHITATENGVPISIMYPTHIGDILYIDHYGEYMAELFSNSSPEMLNLEFDDSAYQ